MHFQLSLKFGFGLFFCGFSFLSAYAVDLTLTSCFMDGLCCLINHFPRYLKSRYLKPWNIIDPTSHILFKHGSWHNGQAGSGKRTFIPSSLGMWVLWLGGLKSLSLLYSQWKEVGASRRAIQSTQNGHSDARNKRCAYLPKRTKYSNKSSAK